MNNLYSMSIASLLRIQDVLEMASELDVPLSKEQSRLLHEVTWVRQRKELEQEPTVAFANDRDIKRLLNRRRHAPDLWSEFDQRRLCEMLADRRRYRSEEVFKVWIVSYGNEEQFFEDEQDFKDHLEDCQPDEIEWRESTMTGRQIGDSPIWE